MWCPEGRYCIGSSGDGDIDGRVLEKQPKPCPDGTYNDKTGLKNQTECSKCPGGSYCAADSITPNGPILPGYYSQGGASSDQPAAGSCKLVIDGTEAWSFECGPCEPGHFCVGGQGFMEKCPIGTFAASGELRSEDECQNCSAGFYCESSGLTAVTAPCAAGWFCTGGATKAQPDDPDEGGICPPGSECPIGSISPKLCEKGTYSNVSGKEACGKCPAGYFCLEGATDPSDCPVGSYCKAGVGEPTKCQKGTFNGKTNQQYQRSCSDCPPGSLINCKILIKETQLITF